MLTRCVVFFAVAVCSTLIHAADWPQFRGPQVTGTAAPEDYPTTWNTKSNVLWTAKLARPANGSPIVVGGKVFVCSAQDAQGRARDLICFDAVTGTRLWTRTAHVDREMPTHKTNPYCGSTPASDGKRVVVWHATGGLHAYDMQGKSLWSRDLGEFRHMWGYGSSPIILGRRVILNSGPGKHVFVAAFDIDSGKTLWQHDEPVDGDGQHNSAGKYMGTWSTPVPCRFGDDQPGQDHQSVAVAMHARVIGLDVASGTVQWFFPVQSDRGDLAYSSPLLQNDLCVWNAGFKGPSMAFRIMQRGDLKDHQVWRREGNPQSIGTGVFYDGYVYRVGAGPNLIECLDPKSGETLWRQRNRSAFWSSIVRSGETAYVIDQSGTTLVFRLTPSGYEPISECPLEDHCNATLALADGRIYARTDTKLWCIEDSTKPSQ